ncbi:MAG: HigA family addiction module antidote protein [Duodenibacillus sp.]|nr:HigA family addiction module antidote protein [Duodenibacillus sp.]
MLIRSRKTVAVAPGMTIREMLENRGWSERELAGRMNVAEGLAGELVRGEAPLTPDLAARLASALGVAAEVWLRLEALYREDIERVRRERLAEGRPEQGAR